MKTAALGIDGCGDQRLWRREDGEDSGGWNRRGVAATGIVEEWRRDDLGGGRCPQRRWLKVKMVSAAAKCWSMGFSGWWVDVADGSRWVFFFFFWVCGFCDQRRARMAVTGLGGVTSFSAGLGTKNSCGAAGYTRIAGAGLGF